MTCIPLECDGRRHRIRAISSSATAAAKSIQAVRSSFRTKHSVVKESLYRPSSKKNFFLRTPLFSTPKICNRCNETQCSLIISKLALKNGYKSGYKYGYKGYIVVTQTVKWSKVTFSYYRLQVNFHLCC